jgi:hypothetical protein
MGIVLIFTLAAACARGQSADADRIADLARANADLRDQVERLTYAAGLSARKAAPRSLTTKQHIDTITAIDDAKAVAGDAADKAEAAVEEAAKAKSAAADSVTRIGEAKAQGRMQFWGLLIPSVLTLAGMIITYLLTNNREERHFALVKIEAERQRAEFDAHKRDTGGRLDAITALLDPAKRAAGDWKDELR